MLACRHALCRWVDVFPGKGGSTIGERSARPCLSHAPGRRLGRNRGESRNATRLLAGSCLQPWPLLSLCSPLRVSGGSRLLASRSWGGYYPKLAFPSITRGWARGERQVARKISRRAKKLQKCLHWVPSLAIPRKRKRPESVKIQAFMVVAGVGFEPTTFRL